MIEGRNLYEERQRGAGVETIEAAGDGADGARLLRSGTEAEVEAR